MSRLHRSPVLLFACSVGGLVSCHANPNKPIAPPDSYVLFVPSGDAVKPGEPLAVRTANVKTEAVQPVPGLLEAGFASEMLRTVYLAGQFIRDATVDGQRFSDLARANASAPVCLVVGVDQTPYARGLAVAGSFGASTVRPTLPWFGITFDPARDKALVQTLASRFAAYAAHLVASGGLLDAAPAPPQALVDGYRMAMEVIAREWRFTSGPAGVIQFDEGTSEQRALFADVRENHFVLDGGMLRPASALVASPGVAATILYRMAQSRAVGPRVAPEAFYAPFAANRMPPGISPAAILGTFRNFQAKLLGAWASAALRGKAPKDIVDLVEIYGGAFPAERAEVIRIFVVTTYGGTIQPGGSSMRPEDANRTLAELTAFAAQVAAGKRTLRDAFAQAPK